MKELHFCTSAERDGGALATMSWVKNANKWKKKAGDDETRGVRGMWNQLVPTESDPLPHITQDLNIDIHPRHLASRL
jgi:hypothetical protein